MSITVLTVDDHPMMRAGLVAVLGMQPDLEVVAEAGTAVEAVAAFEAHRPSVTLMDLHLPDHTGVWAIERIREVAPRACVLALTTYDGDEHIYRALEAGAQGYLLKGSLRHEVVAAVRSVASGRRVVPPDIGTRLAEQFPRAELTSREIEVLELAASGLTNRSIGQRLGIAESTVKVHVHHAIGKLGVRDRTAAVAAALQRGFFGLDGLRPRDEA